MNILQHIRAGHYPKDSLGRALVPVNGNWTATIAAIDGPREEEIGGFGPASWIAWGDDGVPVRNGKPEFDTLLPPPPRKVVERGFLVIAKNHKQYFDDRASAESYADNVDHAPDRIVELTGEYEELWSETRIEIVSAERDD